MKHLFLLGVAALYGLNVFASTKVCVDHAKKTVTLSAHYYFYGNKASHTLAKPCVEEINRLFNNGLKIQLNKDGIWRKVIVKVGYSIKSEEEAAKLAASNAETKNNFVRIDVPPKGSRVTVSEHGLNSNNGYFIVANGLGQSTTCTHEFAHGLGLNHLPDPCDWRGKGVPPIMAPRGCKVDKQYQYVSDAITAPKGSTLNPAHRQVKSYEVSAINLGDLPYSWESNDKECAEQGHVAYKIYNRDGSKYDPRNLLQKWGL